MVEEKTKYEKLWEESECPESYEEFVEYTEKVWKKAQKELLKEIEKDLIKESKLIKCKEIHCGELHIIYIRDCLKVLDKYKGLSNNIRK